MGLTKIKLQPQDKMAILVILAMNIGLGANFHLVQEAQAQPQQQGEVFESEADGFRLQIPEGWVIDDNDIENPLDTSNDIIVSMLCLENEALPGIGGQHNCQAANLTDAIYIIKTSDLQSMPEFQNSTGSSSDSNIIPTTNDLVALYIENKRNNSSTQIKIENSTDIDEFTKIVNMTSEYFNVDFKSRLMFVLSQDRNSGYSIVNTQPYNILLNQTEHSPAVQQVFDTFQMVG